ncbi:heavy-metal-associated domain-containing protein [Haliscomenobacter sp.]|uniref:heavy-metal-associated domain-containing protein n=1 Tax=Haliscomenobacter sp. TaxID=2717303 RepID=UPI003364F26B
MESLKFKTNINCGSCVKAVTAFINEVEGVENWDVDTQNPDKILSVQGEGLQVANILEAVKDAGFEIVELAEC